MKVKAWLSIGFDDPATQFGTVTIPDEDLEGLEGFEREIAIQEHVQHWADRLYRGGLDRMIPEDLKKMVEVADLIVAGKDPHVPVQRLIKTLAVTVLTLRDEVERHNEQ